MDKNDILDYVTETPGNTNRAVLGSMLDSVGGTDLPAVTSDDNGMVLTVVEGVWDKAEGGDGSFLEVNLVADPETGDVTTNKTWNEINTAFPKVMVKFIIENVSMAGLVVGTLFQGDTYSMRAALGDDVSRFEASDPDEPLLMIL